MPALNKVEYIEIENQAKKIVELTNIVEKTFSKMDNLINENVNSGKGIWDGEQAMTFKEEWADLKENIPEIINIFKNQANNIEEVLKISSQN